MTTTDQDRSDSAELPERAEPGQTTRHEPTSTGMPGAAAPADVTEAPAAAKKVARTPAKKASKKAEVEAAPIAAKPSSADSEDAEGTEAAARPARKAAKRTRRTADAALAGAGPGVVGDDPLELAAAVTGTHITGTTGTSDATDTRPAAIVADDEAGATVSDGSGQPATAPVSTFGVLFQAPEPPPPSRSRRATAPASAPRSREDAAPDTAANAPESADGSHGSAAQAPSAESRPASRRQRPSRAKDAELADRPEPGDDVDQASVTGEREPDEDVPSTDAGRKRRRRGGKGRRTRAGEGAEGGEDAADGTGATDGVAPAAVTDDVDQADTATPRDGAENQGDGEPDSDRAGEPSPSRRRTRRRRRTSGADADEGSTDGVRSRAEDREGRASRDEVTSLRGSTRLEAKKQRRREGRESGRRRTVITEAEFLARRESVDRTMVVREKDGRTQIGVLEDGVLVEHYVARDGGTASGSMAGNVYLGRIQNVLPSMEAAFIDVGRGRNAVLYAGEVNWDAAGLEGNRGRRIENALSSGDSVLVQVTKDPIGHKGARLTSQISLPGRYLVYVPGSSMTGISRKLPDTERARLKKILREVVPEDAGVIVRTAAEGASEEELRADVARLTAAWDDIQASAKTASAPALLHGEPDLTVRVIRDVFNEDFSRLVVAGERPWGEVNGYVGTVAPDLADRVSRWSGEDDLFAAYRVDEQLAKAMDRKVWLPSGGSLVIDRTEAMTVVDVNTGKFIGSGGNLEETVTRNNIEAAEEIVRQLRLRDIGGIIVIDFIDMVLESNRDLVVRRLMECLGRDRTKHQVAEVTSLGLVQMTRKRVGSGLLEVFSDPCEHCGGRGIIVHTHPVDRPAEAESGPADGRGGGRSRRGTAAGPGRGGRGGEGAARDTDTTATRSPQAPPGGPTAAQIAAKAHAAAIHAAAVSGTAVGPLEPEEELAKTSTRPAEQAAVDQPPVGIPPEDAAQREPSTASEQPSSPQHDHAGEARFTRSDLEATETDAARSGRPLLPAPPHATDTGDGFGPDDASYADQVALFAQEGAEMLNPHSYQGLEQRDHARSEELASQRQAPAPENEGDRGDGDGSEADRAEADRLEADRVEGDSLEGDHLRAGARRRRGRVVAPAGPPRHTEQSASVPGAAGGFDPTPRDDVG